MANLTLTKAKKILGKSAEGISDEQLEEEMKAAQLLKMLYFSHLKKVQPNSSYNKEANGKT
jgi:hypothetical protein